MFNIIISAHLGKLSPENSGILWNNVVPTDFMKSLFRIFRCFEGHIFLHSFQNSIKAKNHIFFLSCLFSTEVKYIDVAKFERTSFVRDVKE